MDNQSFFISYRHDELSSQYASTLSKLLQEHGYNTWMDNQNIKLGQKWDSSIRQAIKSTDAVVIVVTPDAYDSKWVQLELDLARAADKKIIPIAFGNKMQALYSAKSLGLTELYEIDNQGRIIIADKIQITSRLPRRKRISKVRARGGKNLSNLRTTKLRRQRAERSRRRQKTRAERAQKLDNA
jgi:putative cell wall-binding protein